MKYKTSTTVCSKNADTRVIPEPVLCISRYTRPHVAVISIHPAPYRDPTLAAVHRRSMIDLQVLTMFDHDKGHPYWDLGKPSYPNISLDHGFGLRSSYFHPKIIQLLQSERFDAIVVPGYQHLTCQAAITFCILTRTPLIFSADTVLFTPTSKAKKLMRKIFFKFLVNHCSTVWVPGKSSRNFMTYHGVQERYIFEGCYCLDSEYLDRLANTYCDFRHQIRETLGIGTNDFLFLFAGRMIHERGLLHLAAAFQVVKQQCPNAVLLLIGSGPDRNKIESFFSGHNIQGVLFMTPMPIEDITRFYVAADGYVLPSISETYSLALAHAALSCLPLVTTDRVGAAEDYVFDGCTGYVVRAGDNLALADAMRRLCLNPETAKLMGQEARQIALSRTTEWAAGQFESAVTMVMNRRSAVYCD